MRILFDNNVDERFAQLLVGHEIRTAYEMGWAEYRNGKLIQAAEDAGFPVMISADKSMPFQQNLSGRKLSVIVFGSIFTDFIGIAPLAEQVLRQLKNLPEGVFVTIRPEP